MAVVGPESMKTQALLLLLLSFRLGLLLDFFGDGTHLVAEGTHLFGRGLEHGAEVGKAVSLAGDDHFQCGVGHRRESLQLATHFSS